MSGYVQNHEQQMNHMKQIEHDQKSLYNDQKAPIMWHKIPAFVRAVDTACFCPWKTIYSQ